MKIIDKNGAMTEQSWEKYLTEAVNSKNLTEYLTSIISERSVEFKDSARVMVDNDTRESSPRLLEALKA